KNYRSSSNVILHHLPHAIGHDIAGRTAIHHFDARRELLSELGIRLADALMELGSLLVQAALVYVLSRAIAGMGTLEAGLEIDIDADRQVGIAAVRDQLVQAHDHVAS